MNETLLLITVYSAIILTLGSITIWGVYRINKSVSKL